MHFQTGLILIRVKVFALAFLFMRKITKNDVKYRGPKRLILLSDGYGTNCTGWFSLPFGTERRAAILAKLSNPETPKIYINRRWCPILKHDKDLQRLLKQGKITIHKEGIPSSRSTVVELKKEK